jgi:hypothetical protein
MKSLPFRRRVRLGSFAFLAIIVAIGNLSAAGWDPMAVNYTGHKGKTIFVSKLGDNSDGSSWQKAFHTIQAALSAVPDNKGGHQIIIRPDTYVEANLAPAHPGAAGSYNALIGDFDGRLGSGAKGWVLLDCGDPKLGFKSWDWWGPFASSDKTWPTGNNSKTFSAAVCDRWIIRNMYTAGGDAGLFWDLTDQSGKGFTIIVEDCVGTGRAFGGGVCYPVVRPDEPSVFRRCYLMALDFDRDTAAVLMGGSEKTMPKYPHAVFEDCTLVHPDNAVAISYASDCARAKFVNCRMIVLNFTQPEMGGKSTGIICTQGHRKTTGRLHVDLEDCILAGYSLFTPGKESEAVSYTTKGKVQAYIQFKQALPKGFERLGLWPTELFYQMAPPRKPWKSGGTVTGGRKGDSPIFAETKIGTVPKTKIGTVPETKMGTVPKPLLTKLPVNFGAAMENTPVVFNGRTLLVLNHRDDTKNKTDDYKKSMYLYIKDLATGQEVARFGEGHSFVNAFVEGPVLHVFASEGTNHDWFKSIFHFSSTDLKTWKREPAIMLEGDEHLFNCSVCRDDQGYVMAYESSKPVMFCFKFARSKDLSHWEKIPELIFTGEKKEYSACPVIRYFAPYYYVIYLHAAVPGHKGWISYMARSKDLTKWELSPLNPILEASEGEGINNSDVDLFEWEGNTYLYYATGDQQTWGSARVAMYPGPMKSFYEACFPAGAKTIQVDARDPAQRDPRMSWWRDARSGMFIHWGIMSIPGKGFNVMEIDKIPVAEYEKLVPQYDPVKWDAAAVVKMAKDAGQKYLVFVAKHHDGFSMWDTKLSDYNIMHTPYGKDIVRQLADECNKQGVVFCFYYSILDWHHPDAKNNWPKYVEYMKGQLKELLTNYGPIGVVWFDGDWIPEWTDAQGRDLAQFVWSLQPKTIINNRVGKGRQGMGGKTKAGSYAADFETPEQEIPVTGMPGVDWESCMTINNSWSWVASDTKHKTTAECIRMLVDTASKGGNLLLNIGPHPDGSILPDQQDRLRGMAEWMQVNGEAIHGTQANPFPRQLSFGRCTRKPLPNGNTRLYLHVFDRPKDGRLVLPGLANTISAAYLLADPQRAPLKHESDPRQAVISLPDETSGGVIPVVVVDIAGEPKIAALSE